MVELRVDMRFAEPFEDRVTDEFRAVVRTQIPRRTACADQARENLDHVPRANGTGDIDRQAFASELIDYGQALDLLAARAGTDT